MTRGADHSEPARLGKSAVPFELFDLRLNRPDLVLGALGYAPSDVIETYRRAYERRVRKIPPPPRAERPAARASAP